MCPDNGDNILELFMLFCIYALVAMLLTVPPERRYTLREEFSAKGQKRYEKSMESLDAYHKALFK